MQAKLKLLRLNTQYLNLYLSNININIKYNKVLNVITICWMIISDL